ncbi:hypothetical protein AVEN_99533-1 [Araneus ventricosus]|uniref:Uncharacterized protein n=1 Tax=Araneus ventricosus TaxID=182803 RepID=A0A4Y2QGT0_ARAVE|nr:hypothetical protein AVEN_99533-1 [Araneus ventricosus]
MLCFHVTTSINTVTEVFSFHLGRGGLVVRFRLWGRRDLGSNPDSTEDPSCIDTTDLQWNGQTSSRCCGAEVWRRGASSGVFLVI